MLWYAAFVGAVAAIVFAVALPGEGDAAAVAATQLVRLAGHVHAPHLVFKKEKKEGYKASLYFMYTKFVKAHLPFLFMKLMHCVDCKCMLDIHMETSDLCIFSFRS